jgi:putative redox protein
MSSNLRYASVQWTHDLVFEGRGPDGSTITIDGDGKEGPSPVVSLMLAAAACSGADVVLILQKMRATISSFRIDVRGTRREEDPRRYTALHFTFRLAGEGVDETRARRAIGLSLEKYCSVIHSLAPDIAITCDLDLG